MLFSKNFLILSIFLAGLMFFATPVFAVTSLTGTLDYNSKIRETAAFSKVLAILPAKTVINIIAEKEDWFQISQKEGLRGWVAKSLVSLPSVKLQFNSRIRKSPDIVKGEVLEVLPSGTTVQLAGVQGDWYAVKFGSGLKKNGWIAASLVSDAKNMVSSLNEVLPKAKLVYNARIRKNPDLVKGKIIEVLPSGSLLTITGNKDDWYSVKYGKEEKCGWVASSLVVLTSAPLGQASAPSTILGAKTADTPQVATTSQFNQASTSSSSIVYISRVLASTSLDVLVQKAGSFFSPEFLENEINGYWLEKINALRLAKSLRQLVVDSHLIKTASVWAGYLGENKILTHTRPDGATPMQWMATEDIVFSQRYTADGWKVNYFTENIALKLSVKPTRDAVKSALDSVLQSFLSEGPTGSHYQSVYHPDWNSLGVGWYPIANTNGTLTIYFVFHYGSLAL